MDSVDRHIRSALDAKDGTDLVGSWESLYAELQQLFGLQSNELLPDGLFEECVLAKRMFDRVFGGVPLTIATLLPIAVKYAQPAKPAAQVAIAPAPTNGAPVKRRGRPKGSTNKRGPGRPPRAVRPDRPAALIDITEQSKEEIVV